MPNHVQYGNYPEVQSEFGSEMGHPAGYAQPSHPVAASPHAPQPTGKHPNERSSFESVDAILCLTVIACASMVVIIQAAVECGSEYNSKGCKDEYGYTVAAGLVSFFVALVSLGFDRCFPNFAAATRPVFAIFLFLWWIGGTGVSTFKAPFHTTGNGFFAAWICFCTSFVLAGSSSERLRKFLGSTFTRITAGTPEAKLSSAIMGASVVVFCATLVKANERTGISASDASSNVKDSWDKTTNEEAWGLVCSTMSALMIIIHKVMRGGGCENLTLHPACIGVILTLWWMAGAGVMTFSTPFRDGGNGYFACWIALVCSVWFAWEGRDGYNGELPKQNKSNNQNNQRNDPNNRSSQNYANNQNYGPNQGRGRDSETNRSAASGY